MARLTVGGEAVAGCFVFMHGKLIKAIEGGEVNRAGIWAFLLAHYANGCVRREAWRRALAETSIHGGEQ